MLFVTCYVSHVTCHSLSVTFHLSLTPTAVATKPPSANSPTMHTRFVRQDPQKQRKKFKMQDIIETRSLQSTKK